MNISLKNTKLGNIPSFSLPALISCPARTIVCSSICYADRFSKLYKNAEKAYKLNLTGIQDKDFVEQLVIKLTKLSTKKKNPMTTFRWHVSGDWHGIKYMYDAIKIMKQFPNISFYCYTRNWRLANWLPHLEELQKLPNMTVFASIDDDTISNNEWPPANYKVAYVGNKEAIVKAKYNLLPCPNQLVGKLCDSCSLCFKSAYKNNMKINILFKQH